MNLDLKENVSILNNNSSDIIHIKDFDIEISYSQDNEIIFIIVSYCNKLFYKSYKYENKYKEYTHMYSPFKEIFSYKELSIHLKGEPNVFADIAIRVKDSLELRSRNKLKYFIVNDKHHLIRKKIESVSLEDIENKELKRLEITNNNILCNTSVLIPNGFLKGLYPIERESNNYKVKEVPICLCFSKDFIFSKESRYLHLEVILERDNELISTWKYIGNQIPIENILKIKKGNKNLFDSIGFIPLDWNPYKTLILNPEEPNPDNYCYKITKNK
jgi:hypothetical protein